ncbi:unnamed protein product [Phytophthora fragariaefolia]|uniref:Unnamed protein product n=1 Tax=Phytophthora fragariaefolia TaxID=1490495 RepID=A0A9W6Y372_9STRA|nr:unnamed protein product [Phytophthora fragariaefolia]
MVRDNGFWDSLRTIVRLFDPIIEALRCLEADTVFVSGVYKWFRWLRYHSAFGITPPEQEEEEDSVPESARSVSEQEVVDQPQNGIELLSNSVGLLAAAPPFAPISETSPDSTSPDNENLLARSGYKNIDVPLLGELQTFFREKIKRRWSYVRTNAMGIAFLLDPSTDIDDFIGTDDEIVDDQICEMAAKCGLLTPTTGVPILIAEILAFKSKKISKKKAWW